MKPPLLAKQVNNNKGSESDSVEDFSGVPDEWMEPVKHQMSGE